MLLAVATPRQNAAVRGGIKLADYESNAGVIRLEAACLLDLCQHRLMLSSVTESRMVLKLGALALRHKNTENDVISEAKIRPLIYI